MVEDRRTLGPSESIEEAERLIIEDFDTWDMTGYYLYSKLLRSGVSAHIGTWGDVLTTFDAPGAGTVPGSFQGTNCLDCSAPLNRFGELAGYYIDSNDVVHGFLRSRDGKITTFDAPTGAGSQGFGCFVACTLGLNDRGAITGFYLDTNNVYHGFLRKRSGKITIFDAPRADTTADSSHGTFPVSINDEGAISGYYVDANSVNHGFVRLPCKDDD